MAYVAAILASIALSSAVSAGTTSSTKTGKPFDQVEARLLRRLYIINSEKQKVILRGGEFDINGDGITDMEAYFSPCATGPEIRAYYIFDLWKRVFVVDLSHLGKGIVSIDEKDADINKIYENAPTCP